MSSHGLTGPNRANFVCRVVADGKNKIQFTGAPGFANSSQFFARSPSDGKCARKFESDVVHRDEHARWRDFLRYMP